MESGEDNIKTHRMFRASDRQLDERGKNIIEGWLAMTGKQQPPKI